MSTVHWDSSIDSVVPYNIDSKQNVQMVEFNIDWEQNYLITDEAKQKTTILSTESRQHIKEEIIQLVIQEQEEMDRTEEILAALSRIEQNTQYTQQQTQPKYTASSYHSPSGYSIHHNAMNKMVSKGGRVETDHSRMMSQVSTVNSLRKKQK